MKNILLIPNLLEFFIKNMNRFFCKIFSIFHFQFSVFRSQFSVLRSFFLVSCVLCLVSVSPVFAQEIDFLDFCQQEMESKGVCPEKNCTLNEGGDDPQMIVCAPKSCSEINIEDCPLDYCTMMINCRGKEICQFKMFDPPECGNLSYAGQGVLCCEGLVRRCGMAFLDDTCDMYGDGSEYNIPICIPCGNGICNNFENVCNCPEDCPSDGDGEYKGQIFDVQ